MNHKPYLNLSNLSITKCDQIYPSGFDVYRTIYHGIINPSELSDLENSCEILNCHYSRKSNNPISREKMHRKIWKRHLKTIAHQMLWKSIPESDYIPEQMEAVRTTTTYKIHLESVDVDIMIDITLQLNDEYISDSCGFKLIGFPNHRVTIHQLGLKQINTLSKANYEVYKQAIYRIYYYFFPHKNPLKIGIPAQTIPAQTIHEQIMPRQTISQQSAPETETESKSEVVPENWENI